MIFDDPQFESILKRFRGRADLARRVLDAFVGQNEQDMVTLDQAITRSDSDEVTRIAHRIKGASANLALDTMRRHAEAIESLGRQDNLGDVPPHMQKLCEAWHALKAALENEVGV